MELHTYSSLNKDFLQEYAGSMDLADEAMVFYNPDALKLKRLPDLKPQMIYDAFGKKDLKIFNDASQMKMEILAQKQKEAAFVFMTSANFGNIDLHELAKELTGQ